MFPDVQVRAAVSLEVTADIMNCIMKNEGHEEREAWVQFRRVSSRIGLLKRTHVGLHPNCKKHLDIWVKNIPVL
jgi:hypothetical protein